MSEGKERKKAKIGLDHSHSKQQFLAFAKYLEPAA